MSSVETLTDFLRNTNASFRIFDMGRRLSKLDIKQFEAFEHTEIPYPYPLMRQAWFAVLIWNPKQQDQQQIWFLKFPLDEQGKLILAARDDLLKRLATSVSQQLLSETPDEEQDPLKDNPFSFTPDQQKMAAFHAKATLLLKQPASAFFDQVVDYLQMDLAHWQHLGLQGIADFAVRLDSDDLAKSLAKALPQMPTEPYVAFCQQLENVAIPYPISQAISKRLQQANLLPDEAKATVIANSLRALAQSPDQNNRKGLLKEALALPVAKDIEVLAAIGSRCWEDLKDDELSLSYLQALAENNAGQGSFALMLQDLLYLPEMRMPIMQGLRNPERGEALSKAVGEFFQTGH